MQEFMQFVIKHWVLWLALVLIIILILIEEFKGKIGGLTRLTASDLTQMINKDEAVVVDTRDKEAYLSGHITGSINIPATELEIQSRKFEKYKTKTIVLVGVTETIPNTKSLETAGYKLATLNGGISGWRQAGLPLIKN